MNEINYDEKIKTFQLITENYDNDIAMNYLSRNNWDEAVKHIIKLRKPVKITLMIFTKVRVSDLIEFIQILIIQKNYMKMM